MKKLEKITEKQYNQFLKEAYSLSQEIEELEYISSRFQRLLIFILKDMDLELKLKDQRDIFKWIKNTIL